MVLRFPEVSCLWREMLEEVNLNKPALRILSGLAELCSFPKQTVPFWGGCGSGLGKNLLKAALILDKCRGINAHPLKKINWSELFSVSPSKQDKAAFPIQLLGCAFAFSALPPPHAVQDLPSWSGNLLLSDYPQGPH